MGWPIYYFRAVGAGVKAMAAASFVNPKTYGNPVRRKTAASDLKRVLSIPANPAELQVAMDSAVSAFQEAVTALQKASLKAADPWASRLREFMQRANAINTILQKDVQDQVDGLGFVQFVLWSVPVITAAGAAIVKFLTDQSQFETKLDERHRLEQQGMTPEQAARLVDSKYADAPWWAGPVGLAIGGLVVLYVLKGGKRGK